MTLRVFEIFVCTLALIQKYKEGQNAFWGLANIRTPVRSSTLGAVYEGRRRGEAMKGGERQSVVEKLKKFLHAQSFPPWARGRVCPRCGEIMQYLDLECLDVRGRGAR